MSRLLAPFSYIGNKIKALWKYLFQNKDTDVNIVPAKPKSKTHEDLHKQHFKTNLAPLITQYEANYPPAMLETVATINKLSPGFTEDLQAHFQARYDALTEQATQTQKVTGEADDTDLRLLNQQWDTLIKAGIQGPEQFCQAVEKYTSSINKYLKFIFKSDTAPQPQKNDPVLHMLNTVNTTNDKLHEHVNEMKKNINSQRL